MAGNERDGSHPSISEKHSDLAQLGARRGINNPDNASDTHDTEIEDKKKVRPALREVLRLHRNHEPDAQLALVDSAKKGNADAFTELFEETNKDVYTLAYRLTGNPDDAMDVSQEAYLRAYKGLERFRGDAKFSTWMFRITANTSMSFIKNRTLNRHDVIPEDDVVIDEKSESDPEAMAEASMLRRKVTKALDALTHLERQVVVLRDVYDLSHDAIAKLLKTTQGASKIRLHRARRKLREELFPEIEESIKKPDREES